MMEKFRWHSCVRARSSRLLLLNFSWSTRTDWLQRRLPSLERSDRRQKSLGGGMMSPRCHSCTTPCLSAETSSACHHLRMTSLSMMMVCRFWYFSNSIPLLVLVAAQDTSRPQGVRFFVNAHILSTACCPQGSLP